MISHSSYNSSASIWQVIVRGAHDCWVVAKRVSARTIVVVLERRGEDSLLAAAGAADKFIAAHFEGLLQ